MLADKAAFEFGEKQVKSARVRATYNNVHLMN